MKSVVSRRDMHSGGGRRIRRRRAELDAAAEARVRRLEWESAKPRLYDLCTEAAALSRQGEARHLHLHRRRAEHDRHVRSEARADEV